MRPPTLDELRAAYERGDLNPKPIFPRAPKKRAVTTALTGLEQSIYRTVQTANFPPATSSKRFMQGDADKVRLSDKGRAFLAYIAHRFRRQYRLSDEQWEWIIRWHQGIKP